MNTELSATLLPFAPFGLRFGLFVVFFSQICVDLTDAEQNRHTHRTILFVLATLSMAGLGLMPEAVPKIYFLFS